MSASFFLDTNVFVYEASRKHPVRQLVAARLIVDALNSGNGTISFQVVQEFFSVAFRRFSPAMSLIEAHEAVAHTFGPLRTVHSSYRLYQRALELSRRFSLSWYDSLIVAAALEADCRILYSEDFQHGQKFDNLRVQNPFL
ncbi:MAG: PIN domain-containing protein [Candidatus Acidiferrum sp.]